MMAYRGTVPGYTGTLLAAILSIMMATARDDWKRTVSGIDALEQSLFVALDTPLGAVPMRPDFGSRLADYIDEPVHELQALAAREVTRVVRRWEPRIEVLGVLAHVESTGRATITITWQPSATSGLRADPRETEVRL